MSDEAAVANAVETEEVAGGPGLGRYVGVIYFHGMGSQRRFEETGRLIDKLDRHLAVQPNWRLGQLTRITPHDEPFDPAVAASGGTTSIRTIFRPARSRGAAGDAAPAAPGRPRALRFYEVYWAPVMAGQRSAWSIIKWMFLQVPRPVRTLRSRWRERQRLRCATLVSLREKTRPPAHSPQEGDFRQLQALYGQFEGLDSQRKYPKGSFREFLDLVRRKTADEAASKRQVALARRWRRAYVVEELRNLFILSTMALALALVGLGALFGTPPLLEWLIGLPWPKAVLARFDVQPTITFDVAVGVLGFLLSFVGVGKFLTDYMGDVQSWATYEETDEKHLARRKVLDESLKVLRHVLCDPKCERVVIVAHSLGASVAHDALLALTRDNKLHGADSAMGRPVPLGKIEHIVTMGSPIDKIEYFFESFSSHSHRYKRVVAELRGDMSGIPFTYQNEPRIHWINYWDQGDPISGALHSPASGDRFCQGVENVHVASLRFPSPGASHSAYFSHGRVIGDLFDIIVHRRGSYPARRQAQPRGRIDYTGREFGPGDRLGLRGLFLAAAVSIPWLALLGLAAWTIQAAEAAIWTWRLAGGLAVVLALAWLAGQLAGHRHPIKAPPVPEPAR